MNPRERILEFVKRLDDFPLRSEGLLSEFIVDFKFAIRETFGPGSQYLDYLKYVRFRPDAVFATDKERERCWHSGLAQISNLLKVILNDPLIKASVPSDPLPLKEPVINVSGHDDPSQAESEVRQSLQKLKYSLGDDSSSNGEREGPIKEPLRRDSLQGAGGPVMETPAGDPKSSNRVLLIPGSDQLMNNEVTAFLRSLAVEVTTCSHFEERAPLIDRLNRYAQADFVVVMLSQDFYFYPRTQSHENANVMASQEMIFQLGYLVARLGRQKVIVLFQEQDRFRRPTDYFDLYYISLNPTGAWKTEVVQRMTSSGVSIFARAGELPGQARESQLSH